MTRAAHALAGILLGLVVAALIGRGCELAADAVAPGPVVQVHPAVRAWDAARSHD